MAKSSFKSILSGSIWGIIAKVVDSVAKFVTIPMLVGFYGKTDYGLIALTFSLNAYLRLMDMGMNIGSIRFFSTWIAKKEWFRISRVSQSSIVFYGVLGLINAIIFIIMAHTAGSFFRLSPEQLPIFKWMMYILSVSTVFNWTSNVISQLLTAHGELGWVNRTTVISSVLNFVTAFVAIKFNLALPFYFFLYTLSTLIIIPLNIYKLKVYNMPLLGLLAPKWNWPAFKEILNYSVAIFAMGIFQFTANNLRPLLLSKYASKGIEVMTEYRVIQTIAMLIIAFGGVFMDALLPSAAKIYAENDLEKIGRMVYNGTKYISVFIAFIVFLLCADSKLLLTLYMGPGYSSLAVWLIIWLLTLLLSMHNTPVASLVLATGKTRFLVYSSAVSCILSLPITVIFAKQYNVGSAVIGYFVYVILQISFYYLYYIPRVLKLDSIRIFFFSFMPVVCLGLVSWGITYYTQQFIQVRSGYLTIVLNSVIFSVSFGIFMVLFIIKPKELREMRSKMAA
jgi:O-antigen/teichoic acid export membrane protein